MSASARMFLIVSGVSGFIAVALGAFGAHALENALSPDQQDVWSTAVRYHFVHTISLMALVFLVEKYDTKLFRWAGFGFIEGMVLFSGSLYLYALTNVSWLAMITPFGGLAFLAGWILLITGAFKLSRTGN